MVIPSIFESDENELFHKFSLVAPYSSIVQIVLADNTLVSAKTVTDGLPAVLEKMKRSAVKIEAHLMVKKPEEYVKALVGAGVARIVGHVECIDPRNFLAEARTYDLVTGLAIDTDTGIEVLEPFLEEVDFVLVMTADAGSVGNDFQPEMVEKIKVIHRNFPDLPIEASGGMNPETAKTVSDAGATDIVSSTYIFRDTEHISDSIENLTKV